MHGAQDGTAARKHQQCHFHPCCKIRGIPVEIVKVTKAVLLPSVWLLATLAVCCLSTYHLSRGSFAVPTEYLASFSLLYRALKDKEESRAPPLQVGLNSCICSVVGLPPRALLKCLPPQEWTQGVRGQLLKCSWASPAHARWGVHSGQFSKTCWAMLGLSPAWKPVPESIAVADSFLQFSSSELSGFLRSPGNRKPAKN